MPIRLDPFQNIVGVNWGNIRLIPACTFRVDYGGTGFPTSPLPFTTVIQMTHPEQSTFVSHFLSLDGTFFAFVGEHYDMLGGSRFNIGFHEFGIRPVEDDPDPQAEVTVRIFTKPEFGDLPERCDIKVRFGFGPDATMGVRTVWYVSRLEFNLSPINGAYIYPRDVPFIVNSQFQEIRDFNNLTAVIREISGLGSVADFGTLNLNFQRGTMAYLPPDPPPED